MKRKIQRKSNIMVFKNKKDLLPKVVFLFLITTSLVTTFTLSKYQSTVAGTNSANAAGFIVEVSSLPESSKDMVLDCMNNYNPMPSVDYKIKVSNTNNKNKTSQVGCKYSIIVSLPEALPDGIELSISDAEKAEVSEDKKTYTFKSKNVFLPGIIGEYTNIITFSASEEVIGNHELNDISINVISEQID